MEGENIKFTLCVLVKTFVGTCTTGQSSVARSQGHTHVLQQLTLEGKGLGVEFHLGLGSPDFCKRGLENWMTSYNRKQDKTKTNKPLWLTFPWSASLSELTEDASAVLRSLLVGRALFLLCDMFSGPSDLSRWLVTLLSGGRIARPLHTAATVRGQALSPYSATELPASCDGSGTVQGKLPVWHEADIYKDSSLSPHFFSGAPCAYTVTRSILRCGAVDAGEPINSIWYTMKSQLPRIIVVLTSF